MILCCLSFPCSVIQVFCSWLMGVAYTLHAYCMLLPSAKEGLLNLRCFVFRDAHLQSSYLSYCCGSKQSVRSPVTSTRCFLPENCCSPDVFSVSLETQGRSCGKIPAGQLFVKHSDQLVRPFFQFWGLCELQRVMCIQATRQCKSAIAALWWQMNQMKSLLKVFLHVNERSAQSCCVTCCCSFEVWVQIF